MSLATGTLEVISLGVVDYHQALAEQRALHGQVSGGTRGPAVLLLQHPPVFTAGRRTEAHERPMDGTPVVEVDRGGKITWHGPGQIVGYPILQLPQGMGVVDYVRLLEALIIETLTVFDINAGQVAGRSGVWIEGSRKIAAIGVRVERNVTLHGFALNVNPDLSWFDRIVPCGIADAAVTSMDRELNRPITVTDVQPILVSKLQEALS